VQPFAARDFANGLHVHLRRQRRTPAARPKTRRPSCAVLIELQATLLPSTRQRVEGSPDEARHEAPFGTGRRVAILIRGGSTLSRRCAHGRNRM
jgi:hypothetical protein